MLQNVSSDQGLHFLHTHNRNFYQKIKMKNPKIGNVLIQLIRMDKSTGQKMVMSSMSCPMGLFHIGRISDCK